MINKKFIFFYKNMHHINVLSFGSKSFNNSLNELKTYLSFKLTIDDQILQEKQFDNYDVLFIHEDYFKNDLLKKKKLIQNSNKIIILASNSKSSSQDFVNDKLSLPTSIKDINQIINNSIIKKKFNKNSKINLKDYLLDKNEKKLVKGKNFIILTEKEIQLLELLINNSLPISKKKILEIVWKYAVDVDTHTVETHIYRLRKKIKSKFMDENFIMNKKDGYTL